MINFKSLLPEKKATRITVYVILCMPIIIITLAVVSTMSINTSAYYYDETGALKQLYPMPKSSIQNGTVVRFISKCTPDLLNVEFTEPQEEYWDRFKSCMTVPTAEKLWFSLTEVNFFNSLYNGGSFASYSTINPPRVIHRQGEKSMVQTSGLLTLRNVRDITNYHVIFHFDVERNKTPLKGLFGSDQVLRGDQSLIITRALVKLEPR